MNGYRDMPQDLEAFLDLLRSAPWFSQVGQSLPAGGEVEQIFDWSEWEGPEDELVTKFSAEFGVHFGRIMVDSGSDQECLKSLYRRIRDLVIMVAGPEVPEFDIEEDAWHAPSQAVWEAGGAAGLVWLIHASGKNLPAALQEEWDWYLKGRWPCSRTDDGRLVIY